MPCSETPIPSCFRDVRARGRRRGRRTRRRGGVEVEADPLPVEAPRHELAAGEREEVEVDGHAVERQRPGAELLAPVEAEAGQVHARRPDRPRRPPAHVPVAPVDPRGNHAEAQDRLQDELEGQRAGREPDHERAQPSPERRRRIDRRHRSKGGAARATAQGPGGRVSGGTSARSESNGPPLRGPARRGAGPFPDSAICAVFVAGTCAAASPFRYRLRAARDARLTGKPLGSPPARLAGQLLERALHRLERLLLGSRHHRHARRGLCVQAEDARQPSVVRRGRPRRARLRLGVRRARPPTQRSPLGVALPSGSTPRALRASTSANRSSTPGEAHLVFGSTAGRVTGMLERQRASARRPFCPMLRRASGWPAGRRSFPCARQGARR